MFNKIRDAVLNKLFYVFCYGCEFCLNKAKKHLYDSSYTRFKFWNNSAVWFNQMERLIYRMHYGKAL